MTLQLRPRAMVYEERAAIRTAASDFMRTSAEIVLPLQLRIFHGHKPKVTEIAAAFNKLEQLARSSKLAIDVRRDRGRMSGLAKDFSDSLNVALIHSNLHDGTPTLTNTWFLATRNSIESHVAAAAVDFRSHAFIRTIQRSQGIDEGISYVLSQANEYLGLWYLMLRSGAVQTKRCLALPLGDGLLLGNVTHQLWGGPADHLHEYALMRPGSYLTEQDAPTWTAPWLVDPVNGRPIGFVAKTYIGPMELRRAQRELLEALKDLQNSNRALLQCVQAICEKPNSFGDMRLKQLQLATAWEALPLEETIIELLQRSRYAMCMGNDDGPRMSPVPGVVDFMKSGFSVGVPRLRRELPKAGAEPQFEP